MDKPLITIGISCFNAENTIERAILSALAQDWPHTEIVVVDDCSTDASPAIVEAMSHRYNNLRLIRHARNTRLAGVINTIVDCASGEFIALFDDDDSSMTDRLSTQYQRITEFEKAHNTTRVLCYSNRNLVRAGEEQPTSVVKAMGRSAPEPHGIMVAHYNLLLRVDNRFTWGMMGSCTLMARASFLRQIGPIDTSFLRGSEADLAVRAALLGGHFIAVDRSLITQFKTHRDYKGPQTTLDARLRLQRKYRHLMGRHYASGTMRSWHSYFAQTGRPLLGHACLALFYLLSPAFVFHKLREISRQQTLRLPPRQ